MTWITARRRDCRLQFTLFLVFLMSCGASAILSITFYRAEAAEPMIGFGLWACISFVAACERWAAFRRTKHVIRMHHTIRVFPF